jgi:fructokinase
MIGAPALPSDATAITAACRFANAAGALATTGRGAIPSMPTRQAVEELMRNPTAGPSV